MTGAPLSRQKALITVAALTLSAAFMLFPANLLPVMHMATAGGPPADMTIWDGVKALNESGFWVLGAIVFTASIIVPLVKILGLFALTRAAANPKKLGAKEAGRLERLYSVLETIGRWSMLDVFVVGFLSGAVRFGSLATIEPRPGIIAFALAVVLTMLATKAYDPRLIAGDLPDDSPL